MLMIKTNFRRSHSAAPVVALTIAGSDSSAGAGIQADLKTFSALGVYGLTAVTCIVAETPGKVRAIQPAEAGIVEEQIDVLLKNFPVAAIKTGLLCNAPIVATVTNSLRTIRQRKLVVDPVMIATSGYSLLDPRAIEFYERQLFPLATLITPNLDEAARLLGATLVDRASMRTAAVALAKKYQTAVLIKGGHSRERRAVDVLCIRGKLHEFSAPRTARVRTHGTGCTYSAAIAAELAKGAELVTAIRNAKQFVTRAIRLHHTWRRRGRKMCALNFSQ